MADFFDRFNDITPQSSFGGSGGLQILSPEEEREQREERRQQRAQVASETYERGFLERVFAPFQAPQQTLFGLTQNFSEDGADFRDVLDAFSHGARYFNPWSNERPIEAHEISEIFFGESSSKTRNFIQDMAISLLYDPLLLSGLAKGAQLVKAGSTGERILSWATDPAADIINGMRVLQRKIIAPAIQRTGETLAGKEKWTLWSTRLAQNLVSRKAGVSEDLVALADSMDQEIYRWREEGVNIMKGANRLRGRQAQELLAEALQLEAVWARSSTSPLTKAQAAALNTFDGKLSKAGINEDLFWQTYSRYRQLDDRIGLSLLESGVIPADEIAEYQGTHLRRIFAAFERPEEYLDRIETLASRIRMGDPELVGKVALGDTLRVDYHNMLDEMTKFRSEVEHFNRDPDAFGYSDEVGGLLRENLSESVTDSPYFSSGRFNPKRFTDDLFGYLDNPENAGLSASEIFDHVKETMLDGAEMPPEFWKSIGEHLAGGTYVQKGLSYYQQKLRQLSFGNMASFRTIAERLEIVSRRNHMNPIIAEALGEVLTAAPRVAAEASDAGRLLSVRHLTDAVSGTVRLDQDSVTMVRDIERALSSGDENLAAAILSDLNEKLGSPGVLLEDVLGKGIGDEVARVGSDMATIERVADNQMALPSDPSYGNAAGMYVSPGDYVFLSRLEGVGTTGNPSSKIAHQVLESIRTGTSHFKVFKAILDPVAQFRNFLGNMVLMDLAGTNPLNLDRMIKAGKELQTYARTGELGKYMGLAELSGTAMFQHGFTKQELRSLADNVSQDPIIRDNVQGVFASLYEGIINSGATVREKGIKIFEFNEKLFKLNVFIDKYDELANGFTRKGGSLTVEAQKDFAKQAAALADQALFNYADVPYMVDFARKYGVVPFITFPFKAAPFVADVLHKHPWRILKYERTADQINQNMAGGPEQTAQEIAALPEHVREGMVVKLPFDDAEGRPLYIDMSYFMPWYVIQELAKANNPFSSDPTTRLGNASGFRGGTLLSGPGYQLLNAVANNEDGLGNPIVTPAGGDKFTQVGNFLVEFVAPPSAFGGSRSRSVGRALQAMASTTPDTVAWADTAGYVMQLGANQDNILPRPGFLPQSQAQVGAAPGNTPATLALTLQGLLTGGAYASDTSQSAVYTDAEMQANKTEIARQIAQVRTSTLPQAEKVARILKLTALLRESGAQTAQRFRELF